MSSRESITQLFESRTRGNRAALDEMMPLVYDELRRMARNFLRRERRDHTLQPTALIHEAYLRLMDQRSVDWQNRPQFLGIAAQMMRRILVNHAERRNADKRGGASQSRLPVDDAVGILEARELDVVALDEALNLLEQLDSRQSRIVELRFFGGLTIPEIGDVLGISDATVKREWTTARLWLRRRLAERT